MTKKILQGFKTSMESEYVPDSFNTAELKVVNGELKILFRFN